jgi:hypothetical protein
MSFGRAVGRVRRGIGAAGGLGWIGAAFVLVGALFLGTILASAHAWMWFGAKSVQATETQGVVRYVFKGQRYSIDDTASDRTGGRTVWLNPADPSQADLTVTVAEISDTALTAGPMIIGIILFSVGLMRARRYDRRNDAEARTGVSFGTGLDPGVVHAILQQQRDAGRRRPD